jgi:hypothetical protein
MTRRWSLPYGAWALLVTVGALVGQFGAAIGYCLTLHPRLCANAVVADRAGPWDLGVAVAILVAGWTIIAAWSVLGRNTGLAFAGWTVLVGVPFLFVGGGSVQGCLGPLGVTAEQCRIALGLPPETDWDRFSHGPGPLVAVLLAGWLAIAVAAQWRRRQRGSL